MNYRELISRLTECYGAGEARAIVRLLLEEYFSLSWADVLCGALSGLTDEQSVSLDNIIGRIESGEPVQYVLGKAGFYGREFHVAPGVLIPRPETELLIDEAKKELASVASPCVLDIGTGSGCIAVTMALEIPAAKVEAYDISVEALAIARGNAEALGADNVFFTQCDILNPDVAAGHYDAIISNPPYICERERADMEAHVLNHEPALALFVPDDDPLRFYRAITRFALRSLNRGGVLLFEINRAYGREVADVMRENGFSDVEILKDQFDNDRIVKGRW